MRPLSRVFETQRRLADITIAIAIFMGENLPRQLIIDEHRDIGRRCAGAWMPTALLCCSAPHVITSDFYARVLSAKDRPSRPGHGSRSARNSLDPFAAQAQELRMPALLIRSLNVVSTGMSDSTPSCLFAPRLVLQNLRLPRVRDR